MTNTVHITKTLAKRLEKVAAQSRRKPEAIIKVALENQLEYEEWFLKAVDEGIASADRGEFCTTEEVFAAVEKQRAARAGKSKKAA